MELGVNVDHVATVRQARGSAYPCPVEAAVAAARAGASGVTLHLREDRRHIQDRDVFAMKEADVLPLNLEMGNSSEILGIALEVKPAEVCLVPERREELTTEGGLDVVGHFDALAPTVKALGEIGVKVSMFIDPEPEQVLASYELGAPLIELHTGAFCEHEGAERASCRQLLVSAAELAHTKGLQVNAGHGLNVENLTDLFAVPHLHTLNIGHSIVARALMVGMEAAVKEMLELMAGYEN